MTMRAHGSETARAGGAPPARRRPLPALAIGLAAAAVGLVYGWDTGSLAGALLFVRRDFGMSTTAQETVTAAVAVGSIAGALLAKPACDRLGRRTTMVVVVAGYTVFAALSGLAQDTPMLVAARLLLGVAVGGSVVAAPVFIGESVPSRLRGRTLVTYQLATTVGIATAYFVDLALSGSGAWRWMLALAAVPAALVLVLLVRLPETATWHLMRGDEAAAVTALRRTRPPEEVDAELRQITASLAEREPGRLRELLRPPYRRAGVFVAGLGFFVQITGIAAIIAYSPMIFKAVGFTSDRDAILVTSLVQLSALAGELLAIVRVEKGGRRPTLMTGIALMAAANLALAAVFGTGLSGGGAGAAIAIAALVLFRIGYSSGFGALVWVYASEALPARLRSTGASAMLSVNLTANFVISFTFLSALTDLGGTATFAGFFALCLAALVFIHRLAPETKGRDLDEVQSFWENGGAWPAGPDAPARG